MNEAPGRRRWLLWATWVAAAGAALYLCLRDPSERLVPGDLRKGREALDLDLGPGRDRGGQTVFVVTSPAGSRELTLHVEVPVTPGAFYDVELRGPADALLVRYPRAPIVLDDLGGAQVRVPASRFAEMGDYQLVLRQFAPDGDVREIRYPFRVLPPASQ